MGCGMEWGGGYGSTFCTATSSYLRFSEIPSSARGRRTGCRAGGRGLPLPLYPLIIPGGMRDMDMALRLLSSVIWTSVMSLRLAGLLNIHVQLARVPIGGPHEAFFQMCRMSRECSLGLPAMVANKRPNSMICSSQYSCCNFSRSKMSAMSTGA